MTLIINCTTSAQISSIGDPNFPLMKAKCVTAEKSDHRQCRTRYRIWGACLSSTLLHFFGHLRFHEAGMITVNGFANNSIKIELWQANVKQMKETLEIQFSCEEISACMPANDTLILWQNGTNYHLLYMCSHNISHHNNPQALEHIALRGIFCLREGSNLAAGKFINTATQSKKVIFLNIMLSYFHYAAVMRWVKTS